MSRDVCRVRREEVLLSCSFYINKLYFVNVYGGVEYNAHLCISKSFYKRTVLTAQCIQNRSERFIAHFLEGGGAV